MYEYYMNLIIISSSSLEKAHRNTFSIIYFWYIIIIVFPGIAQSLEGCYHIVVGIPQEGGGNHCPSRYPWVGEVMLVKCLTQDHKELCAHAGCRTRVFRV